MRMAGDQLAALVEPHVLGVTALAGYGAGRGEVTADMIALSKAMGRHFALDSPVQPTQTIREALESPATPPEEKVVLRQLLRQLEEEPIPGLRLPVE